MSWSHTLWLPSITWLLRMLCGKPSGNSGLFRAGAPCLLAFCCSVAQSCLTLCNPKGCSTPCFLVLHYLPQLAQTHVHWANDVIQSSHPLLPPSPPAFNLSQHQRLFNESALLLRWPKYWSFRFSIIPSNEHSELISFRIEWFDLLAVQGTLKSLLQHCSLKTSILITQQGPAINLSLLQTPTFLFVWTHCVLGTGTCTNNVCWPMFDMPLIPLPEDANYPFIW